MKKSKNTTGSQPQVGSDALLGGPLRRALLHDQYGTPQKQMEELVDDIIETFTDPSRWPLLDSERIKAMKEWYRMAQKIRHTPT